MNDYIRRAHAAVMARGESTTVTLDLVDAQYLILVACEYLSKPPAPPEPVEPPPAPSNTFLDAMNPYVWAKLRDWMANPRRAPAANTFDSGVMRDAGRAFEAALDIVNR